MFNPLGVFKKSPQKIESVLIIDPEPTCSRAFVFSRDGNVQFLGEGRGDFKSAVEGAISSARFKPKLAVLGLGGQNAWCSTTTLRCNRKEADKPIGEKELEKFLEILLKTAKMQSEQQMAEYLGNPEEEFVLIDSGQRQYRVDNQPTSNPLNRSGKVLEGSFFTTFSPQSYLNQLTGLCQELQLQVFALVSLLDGLVAESANNEREHFNAVVIRILESETEVGVCFGGRIFGNRTFSLGLTDSVDLWVSGVETACEDFSGIKQFPDRIVLVGPDAKVAAFKGSLEGYPLTRILPFAERPFVEIRGDVEKQAFHRVAKQLLAESDVG